MGLLGIEFFHHETSKAQGGAKPFLIFIPILIIIASIGLFAFYLVSVNNKIPKSLKNFFKKKKAENHMEEINKIFEAKPTKNHDKVKKKSNNDSLIFSQKQSWKTNGRKRRNPD